MARSCSVTDLTYGPVRVDRWPFFMQIFVWKCVWSNIFADCEDFLEFLPPVYLLINTISHLLFPFISQAWCLVTGVMVEGSYLFESFVFSSLISLPSNQILAVWLLQLLLLVFNRSNCIVKHPCLWSFYGLSIAWRNLHFLLHDEDANFWE